MGFGREASQILETLGGDRRPPPNPPGSGLHKKAKKSAILAIDQFARTPVLEALAKHPAKSRRGLKVVHGHGTPSFPLTGAGELFNSCGSTQQERSRLIQGRQGPRISCRPSWAALCMPQRSCGEANLIPRVHDVPSMTIVSMSFFTLLFTSPTNRPILL